MSQAVTFTSAKGGAARMRGAAAPTGGRRRGPFSAGPSRSSISRLMTGKKKARASMGARLASHQGSMQPERAAKTFDGRRLLPTEVDLPAPMSRPCASHALPRCAAIEARPWAFLKPQSRLILMHCPIVDRVSQTTSDQDTTSACSYRQGAHRVRNAASRTRFASEAARIHERAGKVAARVASPFPRKS